MKKVDKFFKQDDHLNAICLGIFMGGIIIVIVFSIPNNTYSRLLNAFKKKEESKQEQKNNPQKETKIPVIVPINKANLLNLINTERGKVGARKVVACTTLEVLADKANNSNYNQDQRRSLITSDKTFQYYGWFGGFGSDANIVMSDWLKRSDIKSYLLDNKYDSVGISAKDLQIFVIFGQSKPNTTTQKKYTPPTPIYTSPSTPPVIDTTPSTTTPCYRCCINAGGEAIQCGCYAECGCYPSCYVPTDP